MLRSGCDESLQNYIQDTLTFANVYQSDISNSKVYKGKAIHANRRTTLVNRLQESKQHVVKHLMIARNIEKMLIQQDLVENAVIKHIGGGAGVQNIIEPKGCFFEGKMCIDDKTLHLIEQSIELSWGCGQLLQQSYNDYDDSECATVLRNMPLKAIARLDSHNFAKIALTASNSHMEHLVGMELFSTIQRRCKDKNKSEMTTLWYYLAAGLRRRLLLMHMASGLLSFDVDEPKKLILSSSIMPNERKALLVNPKTQLLSQTISMGAAKLSANKTRVSVAKAHRMELESQLSQSQSLKRKYDKDLMSSLSMVSQSVAISSSSGGPNKHSSALQFAKLMGVRKMEKVLQGTATRSLREAWRRWGVVIRYHECFLHCKQFLVVVGAYRTFLALEEIYNAKVLRGWHRFVQATKWQGGVEMLAAVLEIQRVWRGAITRLARKKLIKIRACIHIQKCMRGFLGRRKARFRKFELKVKGAVAIIERNWKALTGSRIMKRIRAQKLKLRACKNIQRVFRGFLSRRRVRKIRLHFGRIRGALKMQCLWRRYTAVLDVNFRLHDVRRKKACIVIQRTVRGFLARLVVKDIRERHMLATKLQYAWRCHTARNEKLRRYKIKCAKMIQKVGRGYNGRKRFAYFKHRRDNEAQMRRDAILFLERFVLGYRVRRKWLHVLKTYLRRRLHAALMLQLWSRTMILGWRARQRVKRMRAYRELEEAKFREAEKKRLLEQKQQYIRNKAAIKIQRLARGVIGRNRYRKVKAAHDAEELRRMHRLPVYFRLKEDYYKSQNLFNRPFAIIMQCAFRSHRARCRVVFVRRTKHAKAIQRMWRVFVSIREAKAKVRVMRQIRDKRNAAATKIESIVRGFMGRYEAKKHYHSETAKWFLREMHTRGLTGKALINFRLRKRELDRARKAATKIQAQIRRYLQRRRFIRSHKRLVRERNTRIRERNERAATKIQSVIRMKLGMRKVTIRRVEAREADKVKQQMEELESNLEDIHDDWMKDLLAIRAQNGVRVMLAKTTVAKQSDKIKTELARKKLAAVDQAATKLQALVRGVVGRIKFKRLQPTLRRALQLRSFCVECEAKVAVRKCRECKDRYCELCFLKIHKKGYRRAHGYDVIMVNEKNLPSISRNNNNNNEYATGGGESKPGTRGGDREREEYGQPQQPKKQEKAVAAVGKTGNRADWEEYFDSNAKAKYWFNKKTGEASWIKPY